MDDDWDFDSIVMIEESFIKEGAKEGEIAGQPIGHTQGRMQGMEQGFVIGREVGSLYGFLKTLLKVHELKPNTIPKRAQKHIDNLIILLEKFPTKNDRTTDFDGLMIPIRSKAKLIFTLLGIPYLHPSVDVNPNAKTACQKDLSY